MKAGATFAGWNTSVDGSGTSYTAGDTFPIGAGNVTLYAQWNPAVPSIDTQPDDQTVNVGETAKLSIAASGGVLLSYQWYTNAVKSTMGGAIISGATSNSYSALTDAPGTQYYYCVVTNTDSGATGNKTATATSNVVMVMVNALTN